MCRVTGLGCLVSAAAIKESSATGHHRPGFVVAHDARWPTLSSEGDNPPMAVADTRQPGPPIEAPR